MIVGGNSPTTHLHDDKTKTNKNSSKNSKTTLSVIGNPWWLYDNIKKFAFSDNIHSRDSHDGHSVAFIGSIHHIY